MEVTTYSTEDTERLAKQIAGKVKPGDIFALYGDLGAGKTTFVRYLAKALGSESRVQSPTFVLIRNYTAKGKIDKIYHIDLYRLTTAEEAEDVGINEILNPASDEKAKTKILTVIEWPEIIEHILPGNTIKLFFEHIDENTRKINVQNLS